MLINALGAWGTAGQYSVNAVNLDGSTYLADSGGLTGEADSKLFTFSLWLKTTGTSDYLWCNGSVVGDIKSFVQVNASGHLEVNLYTSGNNHTLRLFNTGAINGGSWNHLLVSVDMSDSGKRHCYLNGSSVGTWSVYNDLTVDFTKNRNYVAASVAGSGPYVGDLAEVWIDFGTYIDFSVTANRRLFVDTLNNPVSLGSDGSTPTASAPIIFLSGPTATWHTNNGGGGGFSEIGALTDASTSPGD